MIVILDSANLCRVAAEIENEQYFKFYGVSCGCHQQNLATEKHFVKEFSTYFNMPLIRMIFRHYSSPRLQAQLLSCRRWHERNCANYEAKSFRVKIKNSFLGRKGKRKENANYQHHGNASKRIFSQLFISFTLRQDEISYF